MKTSQNIRTMTTLLFFALLALVTLVPLIVLPMANRAYSLPKLSLIAIITTFGLVLVVVRSYLAGERPKIRGLIPVITGVFFAFILLSYGQSIDRVSALYGHYGRLDGLITYFVYGGVFLVATQIRWQDSVLKTLLDAVVAVGLLIALLAVAEFFGFGVFGQHASRRVAATLGNPVFLGAYLTVVFSAAFALAGIRPGEAQSKLLLGAVLIILSAVIMTSSRSSMLGVAVVVAVVTWSFRRRLKSTWRALPAFAIGALVLIVLIESAASAAGRPTLSKSLGLELIRSASTRRIEMAKGSVEIIKKRPFLGVGPSNYPWAYQEVQSRLDTRLNGRASRTDDAHNIWLQTGASLGVPALVTMIILIMAFLVTGWRLSKRDELVLPLVTGVLSFLIVSSFEPANVTTNLFFWLFLGIVAEKATFEAKTTNEGSETGKKLYKRWVVGLAWVAGAILVTASTCFLIKIAIGDVYYGRALASKRVNNPDIVDKFTKAISIAPYIDVYYVGLGEFFVERARLSGSDSQMLEGIDSLEKGAFWGRSDPENWIKLALAYKNASNNLNTQNRAMAAAKTALRLAPNLPAAHRAVAEVFIDEGNLKQALQHALVATELDPAYPEGWLWLGLTYEKSGKKVAAISAYRRAAKYPDTQVDALMRLRTLER